VPNAYSGPEAELSESAKAAGIRPQTFLTTASIAAASHDIQKRLSKTKTDGDIGNRTRDLFYAKEALYH